MKQIACPGCRQPMRVLRAGKVEIDECTSCAAVWFDRGELDRYVGHRQCPSWWNALVDLDFSGAPALEASAEQGKVGSRCCARCGEAMRARVANPTTAEVDTCPAHGTFVTRAQLELIFMELGE